MPRPVLDVLGQYRAIKPEADAAVIAVLASGRFTLGKLAADFVQAFAECCGTRRAVAGSSGTAARAEAPQEAFLAS